MQDVCVRVKVFIEDEPHVVVVSPDTLSVVTMLDKVITTHCHANLCETDTLKFECGGEVATLCFENPTTTTLTMSLRHYDDNQKMAVGTLFWRWMKASDTDARRTTIGLARQLV